MITLKTFGLQFSCHIKTKSHVLEDNTLLDIGHQPGKKTCLPCSHTWSGRKLSSCQLAVWVFILSWFEYSKCNQTHLLITNLNVINIIIWLPALLSRYCLHSCWSSQASLLPFQTGLTSSPVLNKWNVLNLKCSTTIVNLVPRAPWSKNEETLVEFCHVSSANTCK